MVTVRPNIGTGVGYAIGVQFRGLTDDMNGKIRELFPGDGSVIWGPDPARNRPLQA